MQYFYKKLSDMKLTFQEFFRLAYIWKFGDTSASLKADHRNFSLSGILPKYVEAYLEHLQKNEATSMSGKKRRPK